MVPVMLETMKLNIKLLNKEALTEAEMKDLKALQKKLEVLIEGGRVGNQKEVSV